MRGIVAAVAVGEAGVGEGPGSRAESLEGGVLGGASPRVGVGPLEANEKDAGEEAEAAGVGTAAVAAAVQNPHPTLPSSGQPEPRGSTDAGERFQTSRLTVREEA